MPAGPIGPVWASESWPDSAWEAGSWGGAVVPPIPPTPTTFGSSGGGGGWKKRDEAEFKHYLDELLAGRDPDALVATVEAEVPEFATVGAHATPDYYPLQLALLTFMMLEDDDEE